LRVVLLYAAFFVVALAKTTTPMREDTRFRDCSPPGSPILISFADIEQSKIVLGQPMNIEIEGIFLDSVASYTLNMSFERFDQGGWKREGSIGPVVLRNIQGLTNTRSGRFKLSKELTPPGSWTDGLYTSIVRIYNDDSKEVFCFRNDEQFYPKASAHKLKRMPNVHNRPAFGKKEASNAENPIENMPQTRDEWTKYYQKAMEAIPKLQLEKKKAVEKELKRQAEESESDDIAERFRQAKERRKHGSRHGDNSKDDL